MRNKKMMLVYMLCSLLLVSFLGGCQKAPQASGDKDGFYSYEWSSSLGSVEGIPRLQRFSYVISITNEHPIPMHVLEVQVLPSDGARGLLEGSVEAISVGRRIAPGEVFEVEGSFLLRTKDLSKEEILALEPFLLGIEVRTRETIYFE